MPATTPWILITLDDVKACVLAELLALTFSRAAARQQADPFDTVAPKIVARVRNKVATCARNVLSADPTLVPPELADQTALLIAYAIILPTTSTAGGEIGDDLRASIKRAEQDLNDAATGKYAVSLPPDAEAPGLGVSGTTGTIAVVTGNPRQSTRERMRGL